MKLDRVQAEMSLERIRVRRLACQATLEGMLSENVTRARGDLSPAYGDNHFETLRKEIDVLADEITHVIQEL